MVSNWFASLSPGDLFVLLLAQLILLPLAAAWALSRRQPKLAGGIAVLPGDQGALHRGLPGRTGGLSRRECWSLLVGGLVVAGGLFALPRYTERSLQFDLVAAFPLAGQQPGDITAVLAQSRRRIQATIDSAPEGFGSSLAVLLIDFSDPACAQAAEKLFGGWFADMQRNATGIELAMACRVMTHEQIKQTRPDVAAALARTGGYPILAIAAGQIAVFAAR